MEENRDLIRVESRLEALGLKVDDVLKIVGKIEPLLENVPKLQAKIQELEVKLATVTETQVGIARELKEGRLKSMLTAAGASVAAVGGAAVVQHFMQ